MTLGDLCPIINKNGFYITDTRVEQKELQERFYYDADDFYELSYSKYQMACEVVWIESKDNCLNIYIK